MVEELCRGHRVEFDETMLEPGMNFYVLGLSPNAARFVGEILHAQTPSASF